jgi:hypothetical protein
LSEEFWFYHTPKVIPTALSFLYQPPAPPVDDTQRELSLPHGVNVDPTKAIQIRRTADLDGEMSPEGGIENINAIG